MNKLKSIIRAKLQAGIEMCVCVSMSMLFSIPVQSWHCDNPMQYDTTWFNHV